MENDCKRKTTTGILAILFDLDNTLIPTRKADKLACNKLTEILWEKFAIPIDIATIVCKTFLKSFRKCPENLSMNLDDWRQFLWRQALGDQYLQYAEDIYQVWLRLRYDYLALQPEIISLLNKLRQYYFLGVITNGTSSAQWEKIKRLNLQSQFDIILVSGDLPWEKPNHKIFHKACHYLGIKPQQCIMIGDKLETDILGGIQADLGGTVWIPLNQFVELNINDPNPDYVIDNLTDLPNLLPKNPKILRFRNGNNINNKNNNLYNNTTISMINADFDDSNSNSSDGS